MRRIVRFLFVIVPRLAALALLAGFLVWLFLPWPLTLRWRDPGTTPLMRERVRAAAERGEAFELRREWVPLARISPSMVRAAITAEDGRFREHRGVDWQALAEELGYEGDADFSLLDVDDLRATFEAVRHAFENRGELRGRSTITQQVAKNLYFTPERSLPRKVAELFVAQRLEWLLDKDRILEIYLNTAELGPGIFGVEAAARHYFGVGASDLSRHQAASLAATLPHPLTSNPEQSPGRMAWRRDLILRYMNGGGGVPIPDRPPEIVPPDPLRPEPPPDTGSAAPDTVPDTDTVPADTVPPDTVPPDTVPSR